MVMMSPIFFVEKMYIGEDFVLHGGNDQNVRTYDNSYFIDAGRAKK